MRYLCLVYMENSVLGSRSPEQLAALNADSLDYNEVLLRNGRFVAAAALAPVSSATSVRLRRGDVSTTNGPFAETKEQLGGFILVEARDQADAARIASGIPLARLGATIEVRPIFEIPGADAAGHPSSGRPEPRIEVRPALALASRAATRWVLSTDSVPSGGSSSRSCRAGTGSGLRATDSRTRQGTARWNC